MKAPMKSQLNFFLIILLTPADLEPSCSGKTDSLDNGKKQIIQGVSGEFKSGELTAIMGPSGAGKTSLLNILTGFQRRGMQGSIKCTGYVDSKNDVQYRKESCYILQDDHLAPYFTVNEIMNMAADLKLGRSISEKSRTFLIDDILDTLSLSMTKETRCQRLSGGQKKRLSIALELIDNPPLMFLDEPTTGLDSSSSLQCISMLKTLARGGRTIVCTIHQPCATIYEMFDHVYVMAEGKCIYQGASLNTVAYLASVGFICPQYHNPADYLLEVANGEYGNCTDLLAKSVSQEVWRTKIHNSKQELENEENSIVPLDAFSRSDQNFQHTDKSAVQVNPPPEWYKFFILLKRAYIHTYRDWTISFLKMALHFVTGIILGLTFYKAGNDGSKTISNMGFLIITAVYLLYTSLMPAVLKFPSEMSVLRKERFNNWYKLKTYYLAFLVFDIPMQIIFVMCYISVSYFISDQPAEMSRFMRVISLLILVVLIASSLGLVIGSTVNPINGTFLGAIISAFFIVVAGFLIFFTHMSKVMYLLSYTSFVSYAFEGLVKSLYGYSRAALPCPDEVDYCHFKMPQMLLKELGMEQTDYWSDVAILFSNFVVLRIAAFCTLKRRLRTG